MKPFIKRLVLVMAVAFVALCCWLAPVYITTVNNWWASSNGFVQLVVSNQTIVPVFTVDTNTLAIGFNTNNISFGFVVKGRTPTNRATATGLSASSSGLINFRGGDGGDTTIPTTGTGGAAGGVNATGGTGGFAPNATTNATGGAGGNFALTGGAGGGTVVGAATNSTVGGMGGTVNLFGGNGGEPQTASTQTVSGAGGSVSLTAGGSASPGAGWSRKTSIGGLATLAAGSSGNSTRTNSGDGGNANITAGNSGNVLTSPGEPGIAGNVNITAGNGGTGGTNANGGSVVLNGGTGAIPGNTIIGRARGGLQVGPLVGTTATLTNLLSVTAVLDFPSIAAGVVADLPVAFAGAADGDVVTVAVPLASVTNCMWMGFASNAVVYVRAANGQLATAQDPNSGTFRIVLQKYQ